MILWPIGVYSLLVLLLVASILAISYVLEGIPTVPTGA